MKLDISKAFLDRLFASFLSAMAIALSTNHHHHDHEMHRKNRHSKVIPIKFTHMSTKSSSFYGEHVRECENASNGRTQEERLLRFQEEMRVKKNWNQIVCLHAVQLVVVVDLFIIYDCHHRHTPGFRFRFNFFFNISKWMLLTEQFQPRRIHTLYSSSIPFICICTAQET